MCGLYLFESHRSPQPYDLLSAYFTYTVIRLLRNGICVFKGWYMSYFDYKLTFWYQNILYNIKWNAADLSLVWYTVLLRAGYQIITGVNIIWIGSLLTRLRGQVTSREILYVFTWLANVFISQSVGKTSDFHISFGIYFIENAYYVLETFSIRTLLTNSTDNILSKIIPWQIRLKQN